MSSWIKVAEGARLVATAVAEIAAKDGSKAATTMGKHGVDVMNNTQNASVVVISTLQQFLDPIVKEKMGGVSSSSFTGSTSSSDYGSAPSHLTTPSSHQPNYTQASSSELNHQKPIHQNASFYPTNDSLHEAQNINNSGIPNDYQHNNDAPFQSTIKTTADGPIDTDTNIQIKSLNNDAMKKDTPEKEESASTSQPTPTTNPQQQELEPEPEQQIISTPSQQDNKNNSNNNNNNNNNEDTNNMQLLKEGRAVPSTRIGRAFGFASLAVGLAAGTTMELASRVITTSKNKQQQESSVVANDANADRLAKALCRMRGAALKMGQMLSIQDENILPTPLARALEQVRQGAEAMPLYQLHQLLEEELGKDWRSQFEEFTDLPFAAASIGQVHLATISNNDDEGSSKKVVVKVQYPSVANSIESDLNNLSMLVTMTGLAPKGLFIEEIIRVGREELIVECDYRREMTNQRRMRELVLNDEQLSHARFIVPDVVEELTTDRVITSEYCPGSTIDKCMHLDQEERNRVARNILRLTMKELFVWRFMQTDPNWGNFLYDMGTGTTSLIDFGSARDFDKSFVDGYLRIVWSAANEDTETLMNQSQLMGFLTGEENETMLSAHKLSGFTIGEPFSTNDVYDFEHSKITARISDYGAAFLKHRLTAPPEEVYTLHRKLAGAYNLCIKLKAKIKCRDLLEEVMQDYEFEDGQEHPYTSRNQSV